jgi:AraC family transcriptional regulator
MSQPLAEACGKFGRISLVDIDSSVAAHAHPQCHALFKVGGVDSWFEVAGMRYPLVDGSAVLVNAWTSHSYPYLWGGSRSRILALYIEPQWLDSLDHAFASAGRRDFFPESGVWLPAPLRRLVHAMAEELASRRHDPARAMRLLESLMVETVVHHSRFRQLPRHPAGAFLDTSDRRIRKAMAILAERATEDLQLDCLAREVGLSRAHFFALFRRTVSITPVAFKNVIRMEHAYRLLLDVEQAVGEVAASVGFSAHPHFTRFFRDHHGITPEAFRQAAWRF